MEQNLMQKKTCFVLFYVYLSWWIWKDSIYSDLQQIKQQIYSCHSQCVFVCMCECVIIGHDYAYNKWGYMIYYIVIYNKIIVLNKWYNVKPTDEQGIPI